MISGDLQRGRSLFGLMTARMTMLGMRQKVLAQNVANVSTPRYVPGDVDVDRFGNMVGRAMTGPGSVSPRVTHWGHMSGRVPPPPEVRIEEAPDSETTLDGNAVVMEEQMARLAETRMDFEVMVGLYRKSIDMIRMAGRNPV